MQLRDMVHTLESMGWPDESQVQQLIDTYLAQYSDKEYARGKYGSQMIKGNQAVSAD